MTSVVQPLDVCLNKPFKDRLREKWTTWKVEGEKALTPGGKVKAASLTTLTDMVERSFKKCSISNAIDGTEDDLLWEEEETCSAEEENEDEDEDPYDYQLIEEEWRNLFGESGDEDEFDGF